MPSSRHSVAADEVGEDADCPFCPGHLTASTADADTLLARGPGVNLLPTVGMMVPGYLLVTTQEHVLSMGDLGTRHLEELGPWLDAVRSLLAPHFGQYLTFEHGSSVADRTWACIEHAHLHLIPLAGQLSERLRGAAARATHTSMSPALTSRWRSPAWAASGSAGRPGRASTGTTGTGPCSGMSSSSRNPLLDR
jgi:diadenosine tetraphosphate (Ap4A) HIT family hydrolase